MDELFQAIKNKCDKGGHYIALHDHGILSRVLTDVHIMRIQFDAENLYPNVMFERMDDDTPNSVKKRIFMKNKWYYQINKKLGKDGV